MDVDTFHASKYSKRFLKWFEVVQSPTSTVISFLPPPGNGSTRNLHKKGYTVPVLVEFYELQ